MSPDPAPFFFLNGYGASGSYNVFRFGSGGEANPKTPVIGVLAGNAGAGVVHLAQPSAIQLSDRIRVFSTRYDGTLWKDMAYWDSFDGGETFGAPTVAFTAAAIGATYGLVDATVYYAAGDPRPYKMVFGIRQSGGIPSAITLADSADCSSWTVQGTVYTPGANGWEAGGIVPSYVFQASDGMWVLCAHGYSASLADGYAFIAEASSPSGPFGAGALIASPLSAQSGTLTGAAGSTSATTTIGALRLGETYLAWDGAAAAAELVRPIAQSGSSVTFDLPLRLAYSGSVFAHVSAHTIDPSIVWENGDGTWGGYFTSYKALSGKLGEYVVEMSAPARTGPWSWVQRPIAFSPYGPGNEHLSSTENPSPIVQTT